MNCSFGKIRNTDLRPIREIVFERLRKAIIDGNLKEGDRLIETVVAENMGVSRTPVREAFRKLELEGLAENLPRKGSVVKGISKKDVTEIYDIREMLEGLGVRLACAKISKKQIDDLQDIIVKMEKCIADNNRAEYWRLHGEFNDIILNASANQRLIDQMKQIYEYLEKLRSSIMLMDKRRYQALEEHKAIVKAFQEKDEMLAEKVGREHVVNAKRFLAEEIQL
jgi:DNA-binding GntR family transcriptional regulator